MNLFKVSKIGFAAATFCLSLISPPSLQAKTYFKAYKPVQVNTSTDYLYPIRADFYESLYTGSPTEGNAGESAFVAAEFNADNEFWFNTWTAGPIVVNPTNSKNLVTLLTHDSNAFDAPNYFAPGIDTQVAYSFDGGKTWTTTVVPTSLWQSPGGALAQTSGGVDLKFDASGNLYLLGNATQTVTDPSQTSFAYWTSYLLQAALVAPNAEFGTLQYSPVVTGSPTYFQDVFAAVHVNSNTAPIDLNTLTPDQTFNRGNPASIEFIVKSTNGGQTWGAPVIIDATQSGAFIFSTQGLSLSPTNLFVGSGGNLVATSVRVEDLNTLFGYLYTSTSTDGGNTWSTQASPTSINNSVPVYTLYQDTTLVNNALAQDPNYLTNFPNVGEAYTGNVVQLSNGSLLMAMLRLYPNPLNTQFDDTINTTTNDHAAITSTDGGNTWTASATQIAPSVFSSNHNPHLTDTTLEQLGLIVIDGSLNTFAAVSPKTGRVYTIWQSGNGKISDSPSFNQFYPVVQVSVSNDNGNTWTVPYNASRTPIDLANLGASQSFNGNIAITNDGYVGIIYTDYRNFKPTDPTSLVKADVWLAVYKELSDPTAGCYGNGLRFVQEVRLTPTSFNAANAVSFPIPTVSGAFEYLLGAQAGIAAVNNDFYVTFTQAGGTPNPALVTGNASFGGLLEDTNNHSNSWFVRVKGPK